MKNYSGFLADELPKEEMELLLSFLGKKNPVKLSARKLSLNLLKKGKVGGL